MKVKKQWLRLLSVVAIAAALVLPGSAAEVQAAEASTVNVSIGDVTANVGDEITIPVTFSSEADLSGFNGVLKGNYDADLLEYEKAEYEGLPGGMSSGAGGNFGFVSGEAFKGGTVNLKFKVKKCAENPTSVKVTGLTFSDSNYATITAADVTATVTINHNSANYKTDEKAATCTEAGYKKVTCGDCGAVISNDTLQALGHDDGKWTVTKEATCKAEGEKELRCTRCQAVLKTEQIAKTDHTWDAGKVTKKATCKAEGEKTYTCTVCKATKTEQIAKTAHAWDAGKVTKEATCKEEGVKTYTCTICNDTKTEKIAKTAHTWDAGKVTKEATCKEEGEKTYTCTVCKETKTEKIAKLAHTWKTGSDTDKDGWKVVTEATKSKEGSKERVCSVCGTKETQTIAKLSSGSSSNSSSSNSSSSKSNGSSSSNTNTVGGSPKTGDNANIALYVVLLAAAVCGICVIVKRRRANH